jgi:SnoaL-like protein
MTSRIRATLALACLAFAAGTGAQNAAPAAPDLDKRLARAADRIASIDAEASRIDDYNQLRNLQGIYGFYQDEALWDQVVDLFADDATLEVGSHGIYAGRESIRRYFYGTTGGRQGLARGQLSIQSQLSPVITLAADGQSAEARWRVLIQEGTFGQGASWGSGVYENRYIKQGGVWKIQRLHLHVRFLAPYEGGWTRTTAALNARFGKSTAKPDRPPGSQYETWPVRQLAPMHYARTDYASYQLAADDSAKAAEAGSARTAASLEAQVRALELKLQRLRAVDEVENLQSAYGYYADMSMQDATSALFTENATLEILGRGVFIGKDRIYEYMRRLGAPQVGSLFNHMQLGPVVHISDDGQSAQIRVRLLVMFGQDGRAAQWGEGIYENTFVKDNGVWKYNNLHGYQTFYTNYEDGWAKKSSPMFSPFPGYPPDEPQTIPYDPYPALFTPPFHYKNPVTGK